MTPMHDIEASVVVVTWNGRDRLSESLPAIVGQRNVRHEVVLVDNGSTDGTTAWVRDAFPSVRLVELSENTGFAAGNNRGFEAARAPLVATINNDAIPDPDWLASLVRNATAHPDIGMFASRMVYLHDPEVIDSAGISLDPLGIAWDRSAGTPVKDDADGEVFGASAGAALYRRELLKATGGFDERFFAYLEDVDLAWRARWLGWRARYVTAARVRHMHSATWAEDSPLKTYHLGRNKVWLIAKNYPLGALIRWLPLILAYDAASLPITIWRQRSLATVRGRLAGLMRLSDIWRSRAHLTPSPNAPRRHATWSELREVMELLRSPLSIWRRHRQLRRALGSVSDASGTHS
ncbi:MAG: glycosyltransferase family 2 protein [Chloroflexi bacterium]|nr:glycosyltransferase family 2 protein [Chloroflexota bacterium]